MRVMQPLTHIKVCPPPNLTSWKSSCVNNQTCPLFWNRPTFFYKGTSKENTFLSQKNIVRPVSSEGFYDLQGAKSFNFLVSKFIKVVLYLLRPKIQTRNYWESCRPHPFGSDGPVRWLFLAPFNCYIIFIKMTFHLQECVASTSFRSFRYLYFKC